MSCLLGTQCTQFKMKVQNKFIILSGDGGH